MTRRASMMAVAIDSDSDTFEEVMQPVLLVSLQVQGVHVHNAHTTRAQRREIDSHALVPFVPFCSVAVHGEQRLRRCESDSGAV